MSMDLAQKAVDHARKLLEKGSTNRGPTTDETRKALGAARADQILLAGVVDDGQLDRQAAFAMEHGAGNCGELSAVAWKYLKTHGVGRMDFVYMPDMGPGYQHDNHIFIVINGKNLPNAPGLGRGPATWGDSAIICDPWIPVAAYAKDALAPYDQDCFSIKSWGSKPSSAEAPF